MKTLKIRIRVTRSSQDLDIHKEKIRGESRTQGRSTQWLKKVITIMTHKMRGTKGFLDLGKRQESGLDQDLQAQNLETKIDIRGEGIDLHHRAQMITKFTEEGTDQGEKDMRKDLMISMIEERGTVEGMIMTVGVETNIVAEEMITIKGTETSIKKLNMREKAKEGLSIESHPGLKKCHLLINSKKIKRWKSLRLINPFRSKKGQRCQQGLVVFTSLHLNSKRCLKSCRQKKTSLRSTRNICGKC